MAVRLLSVLLILGFSVALSAQDPVGDVPQSPAAEDRQHIEKSHARMADLQKAIAEKTQERQTLLAQSKNEPDNASLTEQIEVLDKELLKFNSDFERIATGGVLHAEFQATDNTPFSWQQELEMIIKPMLDSLKSATERPREIDRKRTLVICYERRLVEVDNALAHIKQLRTDSVSPEFVQRLDQIEADWVQHDKEVERDLGLVRYQLDDMLKDDTTFVELISGVVAQFFKGRGMNLVLAFLFAILTYFLLRSFHSALRKQFPLEDQSRGKVSRRFIHYGFHFGTGVASLLAMMITFYILGDWLLMGLMLLLMLALAIRLKDWLPKFFSEMRILLNLGSVREGERVIYQGVPYKITSISVFSTLENPALTGGLQRLPLAEMAKLISRPFDDEPWFPSNQGDWLLFEDGFTGIVELQTPEVVKCRGGGTLHVFGTSWFLQSRPMNLSAEKFGAIFNFGLDVQHVDLVAGPTVPDTFKAAIKRRFEGTRAGENLQKMLVEFKAPTLNSLVWLVRLDMYKGIDDDYYQVKRLANEALVEVCLEKGWKLPVNQVALHGPKITTSEV